MIIDALIGSPPRLKHPSIRRSNVGHLAVSVERAHDVVLAASPTPVWTLALLLLLPPQVLHRVVLRNVGVVRVVGAGGVGLLVRVMVVVVAQLGGACVVAGAGARALAAAATDAGRACDHRKTVDNTG